MKRSELLQNLLTALLTICALVVTGLLVRRELISPEAQAAAGTLSREVPEWRDYAAGKHRIGPAEAPVTIVEFSDFQCPFCRGMAARLDSLRNEFPHQVAVVYRHFPLRIHPHAIAAARASECAGEQGRFWEMHDALYRGQDSIGQVKWARYASIAGVKDSLAFTGCMDRTVDDMGIREDTAAGNRLGVTATPTLLINESRVVGSPPLEALREHVRRALEPERRADRE